MGEDLGADPATVSWPLWPTSQPGPELGPEGVRTPPSQGPHPKAPQQPLVCDTFKNCEGLSRVAFMDGNGVVMLGKVISCEQKAVEAEKGGGKKK